MSDERCLTALRQLDQSVGGARNYLLEQDVDQVAADASPYHVSWQLPYAIAMKDGKPFGIGGLWENWKDPVSGEWIRTFVVITTDANELVAEIHNRMPLILAPADYIRWLSDERDPRDLLRPFPAAPMRMSPISTRVNKPENDDPSIVEPVALANSRA
jgi:putative SOS response-associated peptidase YedK